MSVLRGSLYGFRRLNLARYAVHGGDARESRQKTIGFGTDAPPFRPRVQQGCLLTFTTPWLISRGVHFLVSIRSSNVVHEMGNNCENY